MHHRELLGKLCRAAYETVHEMVFAAAEGFRTGMVVVAQTAGDLVNLHPHLHGLVPRGGWDQDGAWVSVPHLDTSAAERLFRAKDLAFLKAGGFLSEKCGGGMRIISVIVDPAVIRTILGHLRKKRQTDPRAPPHATRSLDQAS